MEIPEDVVVYSDEELINLILQNLIGNAVKYSSQGTIRVRAVWFAIRNSADANNSLPNVLACSLPFRVHHSLGFGEHQRSQQ